MEKVVIAVFVDLICLLLIIWTSIRMFWKPVSYGKPGVPKMACPPPSPCTYNHAQWRLDVTKEIVEFKKMRRGPSGYSLARMQFIKAFELNDTTSMESANDQMKEIELNAGVINDVDIIERLMQIKKVCKNTRPKCFDQIEELNALRNEIKSSIDPFCDINKIIRFNELDKRLKRHGY